MRESLSRTRAGGDPLAPPEELHSPAGRIGDELAVVTPALPAHVVADFAIGDVGRTHCTGCGRTTGFVVHEMVFSLPQAGFSVIGLAGVCVECNTLTAMRRMSFEAVTAAWSNRPPGVDRMSLVVRRAGESEGAYQDRLGSAIDAARRATVYTLRQADPMLRLVRDLGPLAT